MIRQAACLVAALTLAACSGPSGPRGPRNLRPIASPSDVIAAELAFARMAQERGQWTAFAEYATDDAVMFVPEKVNARQWLKGRANPPRAVTWQPYQVWMSCDGSLGVTKGAWQGADGTTGYFTTVWERQRDNSYKWVMDQGDTLSEPLAAPEMIGANVAECRVQSVPPPVERVPQPSDPQGRSRDGTLKWTVFVGNDLSREISAVYWDGKTWQRALAERVAAPEGQ